MPLGRPSEAWRFCRLLLVRITPCFLQSAYFQKSDAMLPACRLDLQYSLKGWTGHAGSWVMVSAGAKQVLMAWQLSWAGSRSTAEPGVAPFCTQGLAASSAEQVGASTGAQACAQQEAGEPVLEHRWLSMRPPPKTGLRPRSVAQGHIVRAVEHRCACHTSTAQAPCI